MPNLPTFAMAKAIMGRQKSAKRTWNFATKKLHVSSFLPLYFLQTPLNSTQLLALYGGSHVVQRSCLNMSTIAWSEEDSDYRIVPYARPDVPLENGCTTEKVTVPSS